MSKFTYKAIFIKIIRKIDISVLIALAIIAIIATIISNSKKDSTLQKQSKLAILNKQQKTDKINLYEKLKEKRIYQF